MASGGKKRRPAAGHRSHPRPEPGRRRPPPAPQRSEQEQPALVPIRLGVTPGGAPGKWVDRWRERHPETPLQVVVFTSPDERKELDDGIDLALVRLPLDTAGLHVIELYSEDAVVIFGAESHLAAADELTLRDLAGEVYVVPEDDRLALDVPGAERPSFAAPATTADAVATIAAGIGFGIVPQSVARAHSRRDVAVRPLRAPAPSPGDGDAPPPGMSRVALVWRRDESRAAASIDEFVGIVRGRTANSSR